jgi:choline monooxygenase
MRARLGHLPVDELIFDATGARDYVVNANWALYIDNYLEGFHIPYVHNSLAAVIDYGAYAVELERYAVLQVAIARSGETAFETPRSHPDAGKRVAAYYFWLFPTTMFNVYPWGISVNVVNPIAVDRTRVSFPVRLGRGQARAGSGRWPRPCGARGRGHRRSGPARRAVAAL